MAANLLRQAAGAAAGERTAAGLIFLNTHISAVRYQVIAKEPGNINTERGMTVSVRPWEVHDRQRRQLAIVVMGVVVAICFVAVVYELG